MLLFSNCSAFRQVQFETITRTQHQPRALALVPTNQKSRVCRYQRFESNAEASVNQLEQLNAKVAWCGHVDFLICARDIKRIWFSWKLLVYHYFWVAQLNAGCFVDSCMSPFLHFQETQLSSFSSPACSLCPPWNVLSRHVWTWKTNSPHSPSARFTRGPRGMVSTTPINRIAQSQLLLLKCELNLCDYIIMLWHRCIINLNHSNKINSSITNNVANAHTTAKLIAQCFDWRNVISEVR